MDSNAKKEMQQQYKEREVTGGVYVVRNTRSGKLLIEATRDLRGSRNRFEFAQKAGSCVYVKLQKDWADFGGGAFVFETLEELTKGETQTDAAFNSDLGVLKELWLEKLANECFY